MGTKETCAAVSRFLRHDERGGKDLETRGLVEMRRIEGGIFVSTGPARVFLKHAVHSFEAKATLVEYCWSVFS